ncbi:DUF1127 domain-containing protein [Albidovulum sp.]|uniref:DUF1127 domain-containing protein n=1 Tax=Albidovulum sp. TaxID=1872424 RepID=UPI0039B84F7C
MEHSLFRPAGRHRPGLVARLRAALALRRHRARLGDLGDHLLDDIGLSRHEAEREASRPVWDVPHNWRS